MLRTAVLIASVITLYTVGRIVSLSKEAVVWMEFSSAVTASQVADDNLNGPSALGCNLGCGAIGMRAV